MMVYGWPSGSPLKDDIRREVFLLLAHLPLDRGRVIAQLNCQYGVSLVLDAGAGVGCGCTETVEALFSAFSVRSLLPPTV